MLLDDSFSNMLREILLHCFFCSLVLVCLLVSVQRRSVDELFANVLRFSKFFRQLIHAFDLQEIEILKRFHSIHNFLQSSFVLNLYLVEIASIVTRRVNFVQDPNIQL